MPLPENEEEWDKLYVMFATSKGTVRRNKLSDFLNIRQNGKIAMKFEEEGDELISVQTCREDQDVLLALRGGKCIRFPVPEVRVFQSRNSTGIRGIKVDKGDKVISMSIIDHVEIDPETKSAYLKLSRALRKTEFEALDGDDEVMETTKVLSEEEYKKYEAREQFILTVTETGFGKRTSSYEYRITHRGGSGIANIKIADKTRAVVSAFPIKQDENILLVTDGGKMIRLIAGRQTMGVTLFKTAEGEKVVSAAITKEAEDEPEEQIIQDNNPQTPVSSDSSATATPTENTQIADTTAKAEDETSSSSQPKAHEPEQGSLI